MSYMRRSAASFDLPPEDGQPAYFNVFCDASAIADRKYGRSFILFERLCLCRHRRHTDPRRIRAANRLESLNKSTDECACRKYIVAPCFILRNPRYMRSCLSGVASRCEADIGLTASSSSVTILYHSLDQPSISAPRSIQQNSNSTSSLAVCFWPQQVAKARIQT